MIFALAVICAASGPCVYVQDTYGPYATRAACYARLDELDESLRLIALTMAMPGSPASVFRLCAPLDRLRKVIPEAYPDYLPETPT